MAKYFLSPFFNLKRVNKVSYFEHEFTKEIIILPEGCDTLFNTPKSNLFGLTKNSIKKLFNNGVFDKLIDSKVIINGNESYSSLSSFFVRPRYTYFDFPFATLNTLTDKTVTFGVPYNFGNVNFKRGIKSNSMIARGYGHKYNLNISSFKFSSEINTNPRNLTLLENTFDLGDVFLNTRENLDSLNDKISTAVETIVNNKNKFIAIGGDHSVTYPLLNGVKRILPNIVCIHIDAHNDLFLSKESHFSDLTPSHSSVVSKLLYEGTRIYSVGIRDYVNIDSIDIAEHPLYTPLFSHSDDEFLNQIEYMTNILKDVDEIYLSIDIDVLNYNCFKSVTDPLPYGIEVDTLLMGLKKIIEKCKIVGIDIVEANLDEITHPIDIHLFLNLLFELITIYNGKK